MQSWPFSCIISGRLNPILKTSVRHKAVWGPKRLAIAGLAFALFGASRPAFAQGPTKLDADLQSRATAGSALRTTRVIVTLAPGGSLPGARFISSAAALFSHEPPIGWLHSTNGGLPGG